MAAREEVVVGKRFTIVIPKAVRDEAGLKEGQRALVYCEGGRIIIEPLPSDPFEVLAEVVGEPYVEAEEEARAERWLARHAGR